MKTLTIATGTFDRTNTFNVLVRSPIGRSHAVKCSLHEGMIREDDGKLWVMQHGVMIASSYSPEEVAERERLNAEPAIVDGEVVKVAGRPGEYRVKVNGDYSDCATLEAI